MCTTNRISMSTYRDSYLGERPTIPFIRYRNLPSLYVYANLPKTTGSQSSEKGISLKRVGKSVPQPWTSESTQNHVTFPDPMSAKSSQKNCTPDRMVFDTKFGPMDSTIIDELYKRKRYSTYTSAASEDGEYSLPIIKPDPLNPSEKLKADMVRLRAQRYEDEADEWQDATLWDRLQSRPITEGPRNVTSDQKMPIPPLDRLPQCDPKPHCDRQISNSLEPSIRQTILTLVRSDGLANVFVRKCPGYAGYEPLCPPETELDDKKEVSTLMTSSYGVKDGYNAAEVYTRPRRFARKAPFSRTVTLTSPLNPYNKVGQEVIKVDKASQYLNMKTYLGVLPF